jgi:hypothetical protein
MAGLSPTPKQQIFGSDGAPLVGGKIYTYLAGTSTPATTYTDFGAGTANTNPIILDSFGQANIWLLSTVSYKFIVRTATDVLLYTVDNISTPLDISALASPPPIGNTTPNTGAFTTLTASGAVTLTGLGAMKLNAGTTAERPTPSNGMIRYNTSTALFEGYKGGAWQSIGTVTSVDATVPAFLAVTGNPVTTSGTLAIAYSGTALPAANGGTGLTAAGTSGNVLTSTGTAWVSSTNLAVGVGQTWQDMTASRAADVTYTNSTGKPIMISVYGSSGANRSGILTVGGVLLARTETTGAAGIGTLVAIVPSGSTYIVSAGGTAWSVFNWAELR